MGALKRHPYFTLSCMAQLLHSLGVGTIEGRGTSQDAVAEPHPEFLLSHSSILVKNRRALFTDGQFQSQRPYIPNFRTCTAHARCKRTHLKHRRALFTEHAWILQCWLFNPITTHTQRDLQLVPTCPCMLHLAPTVIATQPPSPTRLVHHTVQSQYLISTQAAATLFRQMRRSCVCACSA